MFGLGMMELAIILVVVLVLFGAGKLPGVMGEMGKGISLFKKGMSGEDTEDKDKKPAKKKSTTAKKPAAKKAPAKKAPAKKRSTPKPKAKKTQQTQK